MGVRNRHHLAAATGSFPASCPVEVPWPYGEVYVMQALWQRLGIDAVIRAQALLRRLGFDVERALFAMVATRACAPCSELYR
jgi:hypothetical protein